MAKPQFGTKLIKSEKEGTDVVIAVDVSRSMLAQDVKPDRLSRAKQSLTTLIKELEGNRIGIIAFAGTAIWQCPLTADISAATLFLRLMNKNIIQLQGTAIGKAITLASKTLEKTAPKSKAIIILTDGEDHKSNPEQAAKQAAEKGIRIYTIGFGTTKGEPIPITDKQGNFTGYKKDKQQKVVLSKADETLLAQIAQETGGAYFPAPEGRF